MAEDIEVMLPVLWFYNSLVISSVSGLCPMPICLEKLHVKFFVVNFLEINHHFIVGNPCQPYTASNVNIFVLQIGGSTVEKITGAGVACSARDRMTKPLEF